jgi:hypothetical protein
MKYKEIPPCKTCGQQFDNVFDATDHLVDDLEEPPFDPKLILPGGYQLLIGSLLRTIYDNADTPEYVKDITQGTFATLYAAETSPKKMKAFIEDLIIDEHMRSIDYEIEDFLKNYEKDGE